MVQSFGRYCVGLPSWYRDCPVVPSSNRNMQKFFKSIYFSIIFHKNGSIFVYDYHRDWKQELTGWLQSWMHEDEIPLFFDNLNLKDQKHYAVSAPGIPTNFKFKVTGVGAFTADKTPYPKGTMEYEIDPGFAKKLDSIEKNQVQFSENMIKFAKGMEQHMKLIASMQQVTEGLLEAVREMKNHRAD